MNNYFDKIYLLNLHKRPERLKMSKKRLDFLDVEVDVFNGTDGSVLKPIWEAFYKTNEYFKNPSYLGCAISHLSIYRDALDNGHEKILIIEDDCRINRNLDSIFKIFSTSNIEWNELLYLGYIPLSDDCTMWNYSLVNNYISQNIFIAKNLWGLYAYGIHANLMSEILDEYNNFFPMELDRYFVTKIQPRNKSFGISPQIFCAEDGLSDNSGVYETSMMDRSIDARFAKQTDYI
jgi:GR25 family glycosyltransferase involved in LPS biosynthesis